MSGPLLPWFRSYTICQRCLQPFSHSLTAHLVKCPVCRMVNPITARSTTALQLNYQGLTLSQVLKLSVEDLISSFEKQCGEELDKNVVDLLKKNKFNGEKLIYLNKSDLISWGILGEKIGDEEGKKMVNLILSSAVETVKNDASGTLYFTSAAQLQQQSEQQQQLQQQQQQPQQPQQPQQNTGQ